MVLLQASSSSYQHENRPLMIPRSHFCESEDFEAKLLQKYKFNVARVLKGIVIAMFGVTFWAVGGMITNARREVKQAKQQVHLSSDGTYSVVYPLRVDMDKITFAQLAQRMLPPWYQATLLAIEMGLQEDKMRDNPASVHQARKVLLTTRDLLDAFSPVFRKHGLWRELRVLYKEGYEKVGWLQDLDHSGVNYTQKLLQERLQDVQEWKEDFEWFHHHFNVPHFVAHGMEGTSQCAQQHASHLFWSDLQVLPCGADLAKQSLQHLAEVQLKNAAAYWREVSNHTSVIKVTAVNEFHNLRKQLRIVVDEIHLFGTEIYPINNKTESHLETIETAQKTLGHIHDQWVAYDIYLTHYNTNKNNNHWRHTNADLARLANDIDLQWQHFLLWAKSNKHQLRRAIKSLKRLMREGARAIQY